MHKRAVILLLLIAASLAACPANYNISNLAAGTSTFIQTTSSSQPAQLHHPHLKLLPTPSPPLFQHLRWSHWVPSILFRASRLFAELPGRQQCGHISFHGERKSNNFQLGLLCGSVVSRACEFLGEWQLAAAVGVLPRGGDPDTGCMQLRPSLHDYRLSLCTKR